MTRPSFAYLLLACLPLSCTGVGSTAPTTDGSVAESSAPSLDAGTGVDVGLDEARADDGREILDASDDGEARPPQPACPPDAGQFEPCGDSGACCGSYECAQGYCCRPMDTPCDPMVTNGGCCAPGTCGPGEVCIAHTQ